MIRLSIGIEDVEDLIEDLDQSLSTTPLVANRLNGKAISDMGGDDGVPSPP
ncbi:MAG: hypothetical protein ACREIW_04765 [Chthoniobacterales bacterium]